MSRHTKEMSDITTASSYRSSLQKSSMKDEIQVIYISNHTTDHTISHQGHTIEESGGMNGGVVNRSTGNKVWKSGS